MTEAGRNNWALGLPICRSISEVGQRVRAKLWHGFSTDIRNHACLLCYALFDPADILGGVGAHEILE